MDIAGYKYIIDRESLVDFEKSFDSRLGPLVSPVVPNRLSICRSYTKMTMVRLFIFKTLQHCSAILSFYTEEDHLTTTSLPWLRSWKTRA